MRHSRGHDGLQVFRAAHTYSFCARCRNIPALIPAPLLLILGLPAHCSILCTVFVHKGSVQRPRSNPVSKLVPTTTKEESH